MPVTYSQCPFCGTTIIETEGFNPKAWLAAHMKACTGVEVKVKKEKRNKEPSKSPDKGSAGSFAAETVNRVGEALAKEFVRQLFKKG